MWAFLFSIMSNSFYRSTPRMIRKQIVICIQAGLVPMVTSSPGMGKSSIAASIAKDYNLKLIDHRLSTSEPTDLTGLPRFTKDGFAEFAPFPDLFPLEHTPLPKKPDGTTYDGWMLLLDEFNSASREVMAASYKLILDRMVGQHKLHPQAVLVCAGNLATDKAIVNRLSSALESRLIHLEMEISFNEWLQDVALPQKYDKRIISFLSYKPELLMTFDPDHTDKTFCCPRTWEYVNRLLQFTEVDDVAIPLLKGTISSGVAATFVQYTKIYQNLVTISEIIADPENCNVPTNDIGLMWAIMTNMMESVTEQNFSKLSTYANRFDMSMRMLFYRGAISQHPNIRKHPDLLTAMSDLAQYIHN